MRKPPKAEIQRCGCPIYRKKREKAGNPIEFNTISMTERTGISKAEEDY